MPKQIIETPVPFIHGGLWNSTEFTVCDLLKTGMFNMRYLYGYFQNNLLYRFRVAVPKCKGDARNMKFKGNIEFNLYG